MPHVEIRSFAAPLGAQVLGLDPAQRVAFSRRSQPHDMVFRGQRPVLHLAAGCPPEQRRKLDRTTIEGDLPA